ncbi:MAG: C39 family peptidase [Bacilli bacterium]|nr:C39 family peptidase [Bacilli bacterium]
MKKIVIFFLMLGFIFLNGCVNSGVDNNDLPDEDNEEDIEDSIKNERETRDLIKEYLETITLPQKTKTDLEFESAVVYKGKNIELEWITNSPAISNAGIVVQQKDDIWVTITVKASIDLFTEEKNIGQVLVESYEKELFYNVLDELTIPLEVSEDIVLPTMINGVRIVWASSDKNVLSGEGKYSYVPADLYITLSATLIYGDNDKYIESKDFIILVKTYPDSQKLELAMATISIPEIVETNLDLKGEYGFGVKAIWTSSNDKVISSNGTVNLTYAEETITLRVQLISGTTTMDKTFEVKTKMMEEKEVNMANHILVDRVETYRQTNMENVMLEEGKLILVDGAVEGSYESLIFNTKNFTELVASWAAISSTVSTCELQIKVKVGTSWSKYFTYGVWGLGRNNLYYNQDDTKVKMNTDEILLIDPYKGNAFQYKITLRRNSTTDESPKVSLVAVTLDIPNYTYTPNMENLPVEVDYDVPKLNQNEVPEIGGSICSATTSTMLLKYKGFNFTDKDPLYEHRYIAGLVADRGHNNPTYGNWVYNTVTMGAFGLNAYVQRMYSWNELKYHLATVGPVGASIKGNTGLYTTGGHLIVVRGYKQVNGKTYVICNDPNINSRFGEGLFVYYEFPLETFMSFWRGVVYVVE